MNAEYQRLIKLMASSVDLTGEPEKIYSDEFQKAVCEKLMNDKSGALYHHYKYLPLFDRDYKFPELLELMCSYIKADGDIDIKNKVAIKLADTLVKNVTFYFRSEIEDDIETVCRQEYSNHHIYTSHTDYLEA